MQETQKSDKKQYYFSKRPDGGYIEIGSVNPGQVYATSDSEILFVADNTKTLSDKLEQEYGPKEAFNDRIYADHDQQKYAWGRGDKKDETFFIFAMPSVAEPLSRALYSVVNPGQEGLYARVYHSHNEDNPYSVLEFREKDIIPISLEANPAPLADALAITVTDGALTQQEVDNIVAAISSYAGQEINIVDFIPPSWADKRVSGEEAVKIGYDVGIYYQEIQPVQEGDI